VVSVIVLGIQTQSTGVSGEQHWSGSSGGFLHLGDWATSPSGCSSIAHIHLRERLIEEIIVSSALFGSGGRTIATVLQHIGHGIPGIIGREWTNGSSTGIVGFVFSVVVIIIVVVSIVAETVVSRCGCGQRRLGLISILVTIGITRIWWPWEPQVFFSGFFLDILDQIGSDFRGFAPERSRAPSDGRPGVGNGFII
jgi:hypothetical protein